MILAAISPAILAFAIFFGTLRQRGPSKARQYGPSKAQRAAIAANSRDGRPYARTVIILASLLVAPLTIGALHLFCDRDGAFISGELR